MQSSGGVVDAATAAERPAACVLSGPAAGVAGSAFVAGLARARDVLTFDMGGTSTDVAAVLGGKAQVTAESVVGGVPIRFPMADIHTIGAGGGSIAWLDDGGALRIGPRSAAPPRAGVLWARRRGADGDRCEPGSRPPPGRCRPRRRDRLDRSLAERALERLGMDAPRPPKA
jgi:N-methylhydantoinase A/oxoprolinase/acetone carboxylase beta subunit